ncbi:MAG: hypothetical protein JRI56_12535 [Deltaproteobacteria bacterium]|nr:hypothetical protein [Deltaproteobacteria bacterium]
MLALKDNEREAIREATRMLKEKFPVKEVEALFDVEMKYDVVISIIVNSVNDWQTGFSSLLPMHEEITQEGIAI